MNSKFDDRLRIAAKKSCGTIRALADKSGVGERRIASWLAGTEPKINALADVARAANVSLDWLATGEVEKSPVIDPVDARLAEIEAGLDQASVHMSEDDLRAAPECAEIRDELKKIAHSAEVGDFQRARADLILRLAFSNKMAGGRHEQRLTDIGERLRRSRKVCEAAVSAVDWQPPPMLLEALRTAAFGSDMKEDDAVLLLDAIRQVIEEDS